MDEKVRVRNEYYKKWNEEIARGKPLHRFFLIDERTFLHMGCQREGCVQNVKPKRRHQGPKGNSDGQGWNTPLDKLSGWRALFACKGKIVLGDDGLEKIKNVNMPPSLVK